MRQTSSNIAFAEAQTLVTGLENELKHARASWSVFTAGNGLDPSHRRGLHKLLNVTFEAHTFDHVIRSAATMTVLSICRLTDPPKTDRVTIQRLKSLLGPNIEMFAANGAGWFASHAERSASDEQMVRTELPILVSDMSRLFRSKELARVRKLRDEALAHRLSISTLRPTYNDIGYLFDEVHRLVSKASLIVSGVSWEPSDFIGLSEQHAHDFWDRFEDGLRLKYGTDTDADEAE